MSTLLQNNIRSHDRVILNPIISVIIFTCPYHHIHHFNNKSHFITVGSLCNICLGNYNSLKMMWKTGCLLPLSYSIVHFCLFISQYIYPSFFHPSSFILSKFRISVRNWYRLSMFSVRNNPAVMSDISRLWWVINLLAASPPNLMTYPQTFGQLFYFFLYSITTPSDLVLNLAKCLPGNTAGPVTTHLPI